MLNSLPKAEQQAVCEHQSYLSNEQGTDVAIDSACKDWIENEAPNWRMKRHATMLALQRQEMLRHKWIESEKANRDLGKEAVMDWIHKYAAGWRDWYEQESET